MNDQTPTNVLVLLPARARQVLYVLFGLVGLADGSALVAFAAAGVTLPVWLIVATAVIAYLTVPFSSLAAMNTAAPVKLPGQDEDDDLEEQMMLARRDPDDIARQEF